MLPIMLIAALAGTAGPPACAHSDSAFRAVIQEFQGRQRNVGLSAAVAVGGKVVYTEGFGLADRERGTPVRAGTAFGVASVTKAFTGVALLRLWQAGKVDLDAEIQQFVPGLPRYPGKPVTLRALAAHLGGIRHWGPERNQALYDRHFDDVFQILPLFADSAYAVTPGSEYSYSSYGYNLLAMAIERAAGRPFQAWVESEVIRPLGLRSVGFDRPGLGGAARPARYSWYDLGDFHLLTDRPVRVPDYDYSHNIAGGNMVATAADLVRFASALLAPGLLSDSALALLWRRPTLGGVESPMSFGWFVRPGPPARLAISGSNAGLQAGLALWREEGIAVAVVANSWGIDSRSGELMGDGTDGLLGRLAAVCRDGR